MNLAEAAVIIANTLGLKRPIVFFDTETTGTDPVKDRIVEFYFLKIFPDGGTMTLESLVNPTIPIPESASKVHGIMDQMVENIPTFKDQHQQIFDFIQDCDLAGFNTNKFDVPLLMEEFVRVGVELDYMNINFVDVSVIHNRLNPRNLSAVYKLWTNKDLDNAHMASVDVDATVEVLAHMLESNKSEELPVDMDKLDLYCKYDNDQNMDFRGCFINIKGKTYFNFGKNKGLLCSEHKSYLQWMYNPDSGFSADVRIIARMLLNKQIK